MGHLWEAGTENFGGRMIGNQHILVILKMLEGVAAPNAPLLVFLNNHIMSPHESLAFCCFNISFLCLIGFAVCALLRCGKM